MLDDKQCNPGEDRSQDNSSFNGAKAKSRPRGKARSKPANAITLNRRDPYETARKFCEQRARRANKALIRYRNTFYVWTGTHYRKADTEEVRGEIWHFLKNAYTRQKVTVPNADGQPEEVWIDCPFKPMPADVSNVFDALTAQPGAQVSSQISPPVWLPASNPDWNSARPPRDLLACKDKLLNLITGEQWPHSPDFLTMNAVDYAYDPAVTAPRFQNFLDEVFPGSMAAPTHEQRDAMDDGQNDMQRRRELVLEIFGYMLSGDTRQQKLFLFMGKKRSGKGTFGRVQKHLVGAANAIGIDLEELGESFGTEDLIDKTTAIVGDARLEGKGTHKLVTRLLSISGEDEVTVNRKGEKKWKGTLGVRFLILTNPLLHFTDASGVIASRFVPVLFQESFEGRENIRLTEELLEELPGILNLAMEGLQRLRERGYFDLPASSRAAIERIQLKAAPIFGFLDDCCDVDADYSIERDVLFEEYVAWAESNKHRPMTKTAFVAALEDVDPAIKCERPRGPGGKRDYRIYGIRLHQRRATGRSERKASEDEMAGEVEEVIAGQASAWGRRT